MQRSSNGAGLAVNSKQLQQILRDLNFDWKKAIKALPEDLYGEFTKFMVRLLMEAEVATKCGERYERAQNREFVRHGSQKGSVVTHGGRESIVRPRVRKADQSEEMPLETYRTLNRKGGLEQHVLTAILSNVPTRQYAKLLERQLQKRGVSKSAVSRKALAVTKVKLEEFAKRRVDKVNLVALIVDGIHVARKHLIVCIGIDGAGRKHLLAVRLGATENFVVCRDMFADLVDRGLDPTKKYLFVIDGSKALSQTITAMFGDSSLIQRCQEHKIRDVEGYLPRKHRAHFRARLQAAFNQRSDREALKRLHTLRMELTLVSEAAANSLTEGMYEMLTLHRLGITGSLRRSLRTTNIIESAFSAARKRMRNPTRHRNEASIQAWTIRALLVAEKHFRILPGHRQIAKLQTKLTSMN